MLELNLEMLDALIDCVQFIECEDNYAEVDIDKAKDVIAKAKKFRKSHIATPELIKELKVGVVLNSNEVKSNESLRQLVKRVEDFYAR